MGVNHNTDGKPRRRASDDGPRRIRLTNDFVFKRVFGREETTDILLAFVNAVLADGGEPTVVELKIKNPEIPRETDSLRTAILDVLAVDQTGRQFNIEVQVQSLAAFGNKSLYYWARVYADQLKKGKDFSKLRPVMCINILDFTLFAGISRAHTSFRTHETLEPEYVLSDHFAIHFVELPKEAPTDSPLLPWMRYIEKEGTGEDEEMKYLLKDEPIRRAHEEYERCMDDDVERHWALAREMFQREQATRRNEALEEGIKEGHAQGLEQGHAQGLEQGHAQGVEEGARGKAEEMARKALAAGVEVNTVAEWTGLSLEEVENLRRE